MRPYCRSYASNDVSAHTNGLTIYLPGSNEALDSNYNDSLAFVHDTDWTTFLNQLTKPIVTGISPAGSGPVSTSVVISGVGFQGNRADPGTTTTVSFGNVQATDVTVDSDTQITATVPDWDGSGNGVVDVTVTTAGGTSNTSAVDQFHSPVVTAVSPTSRQRGGRRRGDDHGGTGFTGATEVDFGTGNPVLAAFRVHHRHADHAQQPAGTGVVDVTVVTPGGTSCPSPADQFTYPGTQSPESWEKQAMTANPISPVCRRASPARAWAGITCPCWAISNRTSPWARIFKVS